MTVRAPGPTSVTLGALATNPPSPTSSRHPHAADLTFNTMANQFTIPTRQTSHTSMHSTHSLSHSHSHSHHPHLHHHHHHRNNHARDASSQGPRRASHISVPMEASTSNRESVSADRSRGGERWFSDRDRRGSASVPPSAPSSASGSKNSSFIGTPRLLSRRGSARDVPARPVAVGQSEVAKGKDREDPLAVYSDTGGSPEEEVIETAELRLDRDPETGRKMINQYLVLHEIGHGTHGRVRLGRDMSVDVPPDELEADLATGSGPFYAIKIVERNPRAKRLAGLGRQRALARSGGDAGKILAENEIRKEIAIAKKLHHPNVVRMKEIIDSPESSKLFMIFEYCDGGEVEWKAADGGPALTLAQTRQIFRDTLLGLEYLHHQGIIHRDIKPSNLLRSGDTHKISDFGCSHFSEALLSAAEKGGEEQYVDDIELAKTAGSPAFFAPEMCYTEIPDEPIPTFKVRPPSSTECDRPRSTTPGFTVLNRVNKDNETTPRPAPPTHRSVSTLSIPRKPRLPITNAIDVWALGVTLYCLLFGTTPFDAANEYLLMQEIPTAQYAIPAKLSREGLSTDGSNSEANEVLDLLSRLLEKDATKRVSVDQAKHHPFTLRGLSDPEGWLASTDPHAQSFVTVTNEEVAAAVTRGHSIREKFRRGFNSISRRLGFGRHRSHSNTDATEMNGEHSGGSGSGTESATRRVASDNGSFPSQSNLARRLSVLSRDRSRAESPRPGLLASHLADRNTSPSTPVHVEDTHPRAPLSSNEATPRLMPSASSLDRYGSDSFRMDSPTLLGRRQSSDLTVDPRPRTGSNASSSASSVLGAVLGRNIFARADSVSKRGSQRSANGLRERGYTQTSEESDNVFAGSFASSTGGAFPRAPSSEFLRGRSFDELGRRQSVDTLGEPSSPSSNSHGHFGHMSPERVAWPSSFRSDRGGLPPRRGSTLSEDIRPVIEDEEVDWDGGIPDSDDEGDDDLDGLPKGHGLTSAPADWNLSECIDALEARERLRHSPVRAPTRSLGHLRPEIRTGSPIRAPPSSFGFNGRAKSPLSTHDAPRGGVATAPRTPQHPSLGVSTAPHTPRADDLSMPTTPHHLPATPEAFADADEDEDDGIVIAARGRRGSALSRGNSLARRELSGSVSRGCATPSARPA